MHSRLQLSLGLLLYLNFYCDGEKLQDQAQQPSSNSFWEGFRWRERQLQESVIRIPGCHRVYTWDDPGFIG